MLSNRKRFFLAVGVVLLLAVGLLFLIPTTRLTIVGYLRGEPFHKGRPVGFWIHELQSEDRGNRVSERAAIVLGEMGPQAMAALPALTAALEDNEQEPWRCLNQIGKLKKRPDEHQGAVLLQSEMGLDPMPFTLRYSDEALEQLKKMRPFDRAAILDQIEQILMVNPTLESKARVKLLRQPAPTQYRLRVGEFRVFYDVAGETVSVIQILSKEQAIAYLGEPS